MRTIFTATLGTETITFSPIPTGQLAFEEACLFRKGGYGEEVPLFGVPLRVWSRLAAARTLPYLKAPGNQLPFAEDPFRLKGATGVAS